MVQRSEFRVPAASTQTRRSGENGAFMYWLMVVGLGCMTMAGVSFGASSFLAQKGTEKLLRVSLLLPKLKSNHGERKADAFRTSEPVPSAMAHPKERATPTPAYLPPVFEHPKVTIIDAPLAFGSAPTPEPQLASHEPWRLMMPAAPELPRVETCLEPVVYLEPCAQNRGDTPMMRNWKFITMVSLLSVATMPLTPPPAIAGEKQVTLEELNKSIQALTKRIGNLENKKLTADDQKSIAEIVRAELKESELKKNLDQVKAEVETLRGKQLDQSIKLDAYKNVVDELIKKLPAGSSGPSVDKAFMDELRTMLKGINDTLAKVGPTQERRSMSAPTGNGDFGPARVKIVNQYPAELLFVINGAFHRVGPRSTMVLDVPAGNLSYEVIANGFGSLERRTVAISSGNTFNLSAQ